MGTHLNRGQTLANSAQSYPPQKLHDLIDKATFTQKYVDLNFPSSRAVLTLTAPAFGAVLASGSMQGYLFDGTAVTSEQLFFYEEIPHAYQAGTSIQFHVHWSPATADAGNVKWFIDYSWCNRNAVWSVPTTISIVQAASGTAWTNQRADFAAIVGTGMTAGSSFAIRIYRTPADAQDTYEHNAWFIQFGIHLYVNSLGSAGL